MLVADPELRPLGVASLEIPQDRRPALRRFAVATLDGEDHLLPGAQRRQGRRGSRPYVSRVRVHIDAVHSEVDGLEVRDRADPPKLVLGLPARVEVGGRRRRERPRRRSRPGPGRAGIARAGTAALLSAPLECRQQPTLKLLLKPPPSRPPQRDRLVAQAWAPRLSETLRPYSTPR